MKRQSGRNCAVFAFQRGWGGMLLCLGLATASPAALQAQCPLLTQSPAPAREDGAGLLSFHLPEPQAIQTQGEGRRALNRLKDFLLSLDGAALQSLDYPKRRELLEKHQQAVDVYRRIGRDFLKAEDWLVKASLSLYHAMIPFAEPDRRDIRALSSSAVTDFNRVLQAARSIEANRGRDFDSYMAAEQLGLDVLEPAPEIDWLKRFVDLAVLVAAEHPREAGALGTNLGRLVCASSELYREVEDQAYLNRVHALLIQLDGGRLGEAQSIYRFDRRLTEVFSLPPAEWSDWRGGACPSSGRMEELPAYSVTEEFPALPEDDLRTCLGEAESLFEGALSHPAEVLEAASYFEKYGDFLIEEAQFLTNRASRLGEAFDKRLYLMERALSAYLRGIRLSPAAGREGAVDRLRGRFQRHVSEFGQELFWAMHWKAMTQLLEEMLEKGALVRRGGPLLAESQVRTVHGLLARAYSMLGDSSKAVFHLVRGDIDRQRLADDRREFAAFGIRPGEQSDQPDGTP